MGVSENKGPQYSTLNSRILRVLQFAETLNPKPFIEPFLDPVKEPFKDPSKGSPNFRELPNLFDVHLKDQMTLKSRGPIPIYYESLYGI